MALRWLGLMVMCLAVVLLVSDSDARVPSYRWARGSIEVKDYTSNGGDYVAQKVAEWNAALPKRGPRLWYHRIEARQNCANVKKQRGVIVVCNIATGQAIACDGASSGCTAVYADVQRNGDTVIYAAKVMLGFDVWPDPRGPHSDAAPYGCHELGHALGMNHDDSDGSCMNLMRDTPGPRDAAKLARMYR